MQAFQDHTPIVPFGIFDLASASQFWQLSDVTVLPEWQGWGVGRKLVKCGIERVKEGVAVGGLQTESEVYVDLQTNPGAQVFCEQLGFEKYSEWEMDGLEWNEMIWWGRVKDVANDHSATTS